MKKFLIFLVAIVVVVCFGLTTFYFLRNDETITIDAKELYCNAGETISLDSLEISRKKANRKTTFNYNAGGEAVSSLINFDEEKGYYVVSNDAGGDITLVISTSNKKFAEFTITVHVGNGSEEYPYYIFNESDLNKIGTTYEMGKNYKLMNNITLTNGFAPIGFDTATKTGINFTGNFDGNGFTISGLNLSSADYEKAGLFYAIGSTGKVSNLVIDRTNIAGAYTNAGVLAGTIAGTVQNVGILNASINNTASNGFIGALAGVYSGSTLKTTYANNINIVIGENNATTDNVVVGGLVGKLENTTAQATYVNEASISMIQATGLVGGYAGEFVIGTNSGSIQQSYANTTSDATDFASFVNTVSTNATFDSANANMLRHFIGNIAIVQNKTVATDILDADLVKNYDNTYFTNVTYPANAVFFDEMAAQYMIRGYASVVEALETNEYVFYSVDAKTNWDTEFVWKTSTYALPTLRMGAVQPASPASDYFRKDLEEKKVSSVEALLNILQNNTEGKIKLMSDLDLGDTWTPVALKNFTIDGNGKTITLKLNNKTNNAMGLFSTIDNSTIENLNIVVTGVTANASYAGALAGRTYSTDNLTNTSIKNVHITYTGDFTATEFDAFGGMIAQATNTIITDSSVSGLVMNSSVDVIRAGGLVGNFLGGEANNNQVSATISGSSYVGGLTGVNMASLTNNSGVVVINYNQSVNNAKVGGIVGLNEETIINNDFTVTININNSNGTLFVGGVAGENNEIIENTTVKGTGISVADIEGKIYVGGVAGVNSSKIANTHNTMTKIGDYRVNKNIYVGGLTAINNGEISQCLTASNIYGNVVAGITAEMKISSSAKIDQVVVGVYNSETKALSQNEIKGDKYVAGIVVDFRVGTITNVQAASKIIGGANSTRSSLAVLVFPYGATLKNATIDSSISGYGIKYRDTWSDFASYENKADFDLDSSSTRDARFNLYKNDTHHGCLQSVVINSKQEGVNSAIAAMGEAWAWSKDYDDSSESSYIKVVDGFSNLSQFQGSFTFVCAKSVWFGIEHTATKQLTFNIGQIWESNNGISLLFLNNI